MHFAGSCSAFHPPVPQVILRRAASNPFISQLLLIQGVALTKVQYLALGLFQPYEVHVCSLRELVHVPLDGIPSFRCVSHIVQLGVNCRLAEGDAQIPLSMLLMKILKQ